MDQEHATPLASPDSLALFQAMADRTRQKLLQLLVTEELSVSELVAILRQPQSTISRHLNVLRRAGLVSDRRDGTTSLYRVRTEANGSELVAAFLAWVRRHPLPPALRSQLARVLRSRADGAVAFFERLRHRWDDLRSRAFGDSFAGEAFLALLPPDWTVADIGTGTGFLLPALAGQFRKVFAVDPAPAMLECARQRVADRGLKNVTFQQGDLARLPLRSGACDLAIACLVLHHLPQPPQALAEIHRVVRPGGHVLLVEQQAHENQRFYETMQDYWWGFEPRRLARDVAVAGFVNVRHRPLPTDQKRSTAIDAPGLFVLTAQRPRRLLIRDPVDPSADIEPTKETPDARDRDQRRLQSRRPESCRLRAQGD